MNMINHHPDQATLVDYSAGALSESMSLAVATHITMCPRCQKRLQELDAAGASSMEQLMPMSMSDAALDSIMAKLGEQEKPVQKLEAAPKARPHRVPPPLADYLPNGDYDSIPWKSMAPGVKTWIVPDVDAGDGNLRLMHIAPGVTIPEHGHHGNELTLVLKGSFSDEVGRFKAGDIADLDADIEHQPIADTDEPCICLIVTEGPLQFKSVMPRIVQYFTGF